MLIINILIIHFINQTTTTKTLYEKHNIHEKYTYDYTCQTYIYTKYAINMSYIHLKSNIKQTIYMLINTITNEVHHQIQMHQFICYQRWSLYQNKLC